MEIEVNEVNEVTDKDNTEESNENVSKIDSQIEKGDADPRKDVDISPDPGIDLEPAPMPRQIHFTRSKNPINLNLDCLKVEVDPNVDLDPPTTNSRSGSKYRNRKQRLKSKALNLKENKNKTKNTTTTKDCIICGVTVVATKKILNSITENEKRVRANGLVELLHLPQIPFFQDFRSSQFCVDCHQNILQVVEEFGMLERIQEQVSRRKEEVKTLVKANYQRVTRSKSMSRSSKDSDSYVGVVGRIFHGIGSQPETGSDTEEPIPRGESGQKPKVTAKRARKVKVIQDQDQDEPSPSRRRGEKRKINAEITTKKKSQNDGSFVEVKREVMGTGLLETENSGDHYPDLDLDPDPEYFQEPPLYDDSSENENDPWEGHGHTEAEADEMIDLENKTVPKKKVRSKARKLISSSEVKVHKIRDKLPTPYKCRVEGCDKAFTTDGRRRQHDQKIHGGIRPSIFKCEDCGSMFSNSITFRRHQRVKHDPNHVPTIEYRCSNCSMKFLTQTELEAHVLLHSQESSHFTCIICSTIFSNSIDLKTHMKMNHLESVGSADEIIGKYKCGECGLTCKSKSGLRHHKQRHTGDLPFKCTVLTPGQGQGHCTAAFVKQHELEEHMISHSDSKMYQCDICGKELKYKKGLSRHRKRHEALRETGRFRYECKVCPKTFNENYALKRHEETHSKINPYVCEVCGKTFSVHHNYFLHSKIHKKHLGSSQPSKSKPKSMTQTQNSKNTNTTTMIVLDDGQNNLGENNLAENSTSVVGYLVGVDVEALDPEENIKGDECEWSTIVVSADGVEQSENFECFIHTGNSSSEQNDNDNDIV